MSDAARELPQRFHSLGTTELLLELPAFGDVLQRPPRCTRKFRIRILRLSAQNDRSLGAVGTNDTKFADHKCVLGEQGIFETPAHGSSIVDVDEPLEFCR